MMAGCMGMREERKNRKDGGINVKKDFGVKNWLLPMPVLMVGSYNDDETANVMTAAWGGTGSDDLLTVCIDSGHKTWTNIKKRRAFTVAVG